VRPVKEKRSALIYPLDSVLGSPAAVRLSRALIYETDTAVSASEAARLAGLTQAGARRALERMRQIGILRRSGSGRSHRYEVCAESPFVGLLAQLFDEEDQRYRALLSGLRNAFALPDVISAWIDSSAGSSAEVIRVITVVTPEGMASLHSGIRERLLQVERQFGILVESNEYLKADAPSMGEGSQLLWGVPPLHESRASYPYSREGLVAFIVAQPQIVSRAQRHLRQLIKENQGAAEKDILEWIDILKSYSLEQLSTLLLSRTERAERLWRSAPFVAVMTDAEWKLFQKGA